MQFQEGFEARVEEFIAPFFVNKDPAHNLTHILQVKRKIRRILLEYPNVSPSIIYSIYFHGLNDQQSKLLEEFLLANGISLPDIEKFKVLSQSINSSGPLSDLEEQIIHDAHVLEGGPYYFAIKSIITGSHWNQNLQQTLSILTKNLSKAHCYVDSLREEFEQMVAISTAIIDSLRDNCLM